MKTSIDCLPCILRQVLEAARMTTEEPELQDKIMVDALKILADYKQYHCSPDISKVMHRIVKDYTGVEDPYATIKANDIQLAYRVYPILEQFLKRKHNDLYWALKTAAVGNTIDMAVNLKVDLEQCIEEELEKQFAICDLDVFEKKLEKAKTLLIIGDNAGETVFDRVLIKRLSHLKVTYAVRNSPTLNDATVADAYASGLGECATVMSSGCDTPGTILKDSSKAFMEILQKADLIISKGQGNFEALSDDGKNIFYLLKAKCPVISKQFNVPLQEYVFKYGG